MVNFLQGPIPGQSLTDTPRNSPWERPAEIDTVEGAVKHYVNKLADPDILDDLAVAFELGADLKTLTETFMLTGSMKGLHTVEVGMLAGPAVASFIKVAMDSMGVDTPELPVSFEEKATAREKKRLDRLLKFAVEKGLEEGGPSDPGVAMLQAAMGDTNVEATPEEPEVEPQEEQMTPPEPQGAGLMARRGTV